MTTRAHEDCTLFILSDAALRRSAADHPDLWRAISELVVQQPDAALRLAAEVLTEPPRVLLSADCSCFPMTVSRAYSQLEAEGVLERLRGKGMAVAARRQRSDSVAARMQQLEPALREAARHGRELELPVDRVLARLRQLLEEEDA